VPNLYKHCKIYKFEQNTAGQGMVLGMGLQTGAWRKTTW
jgi:hypothetical protein